MSKMKKTRKPGGGRKKLKPEYDAGKNLKDQMDAAVALYEEDCSLQSIADVLNLNPIKVRKLLITAGVYESEVAEEVQDTFERYRKTQDYKTSILSTATVLGLSKASVTSYLPYKKGVYFQSTEKEKISVGAERQRRYRAVRKLRTEPTEEHLWEVVLLYAGVRLKTYSGLPFTYEIRKGRNGQYTKELWIQIVMEEAEFVESVRQARQEPYRVRRIERQIRQLTAEKAHTQGIKEKLYGDYADEILTREDFLNYNELYSKRIEEYNRKITELEAERQNLQTAPNTYPFLDVYRKYRKLEEITRPMVVELIEKIEVYEGNRVEITFRFQDEIADLLEELHQKQLGQHEVSA